jgi:DNA-binding NarL/FixJ family response regulator
MLLNHINWTVRNMQYGVSIFVRSIRKESYMHNLRHLRRSLPPNLESDAADQPKEDAHVFRVPSTAQTTTLVAAKPNSAGIHIRHGQDDDREGETHHKREQAVISVLLVDDHALMREGLRRLLEEEDDLQVIGEAVDGFDALRQIRRLKPDVVLMDIRMPVMDGIAVTRQIVQTFPETRVIMLTMFREEQQMLQAMHNGARGYLLKSASSQEVAQAIRVVSAGDVYIEPALTGAIVSEFRRLAAASTKGGNGAGGAAIYALSEKEIEILRHVAKGLSNKEIAGKLAYSEKTVKNYLSIIFQKLGIRDRTQAAIFALKQGLLTEE